MRLLKKIAFIRLKLKELLMGCRSIIKKHEMLLNYCILNNAGDRFNVDFISDSFRFAPGKYSFGRKSHFLFCGSILSRSNSHSILIGAGFISEEESSKKIKFSEVVGIRGQHSLEHIRRDYPGLEVEFLGDPGLLAKEVVNASSSPLPNDFIGIIPHFIDIEQAEKLTRGCKNFRIIDIKRPYQEVCEKIKECGIVLSSSLHGLVFSDAMNVPNAWVSFGGNIKGGNYKFLDYYSVMTNPRKSPYICVCENDLRDAARAAQISENPFYDRMRSAVYDRFGKLAPGGVNG